LAKNAIINRKKLLIENRAAELQEQTDATKKANDEATAKSKKKAEEDAAFQASEKKRKLKEQKEFNESVLKGQNDLQIATNEAEFNQRILDQEAQDEKIRILNEGVEEVAKAEETEYRIKKENQLKSV
jgi:hypothetical protein